MTTSLGGGDGEVLGEGVVFEGVAGWHRLAALEPTGVPWHTRFDVINLSASEPPSAAPRGGTAEGGSASQGRSRASEVRQAAASAPEGSLLIV